MALFAARLFPYNLAQNEYIIETKSLIKSDSSSVVPFKRNKHFNKIYSKGKIKNGIRLSNKEITFNFEIEDVETGANKPHTNLNTAKN